MERNRERRVFLGGSGAALVASVVLLGLNAGATAQEAVDPAAIHTRLVAIQPEQGGQARPVVALANPTGTDDPARLQDTVGGILARELFRQALLIAARDELGLATRDELLGDAAPAEAAGDPRAELITLLRYGTANESRVLVRRTDGPRAETLLAQDLPGMKRPFGEPPRLVEAAEVLSRTGFPSALRKLGLDGRPNAIHEAAQLPVGVEERLWRLGYTEPFAAVRALHEAIRAGGESPARLAGLVRGYALLGLLTEHHWHPAHKAFKARALLYAQRMVVRDPKGHLGLWHRAFAESLLGMHKDALADIAEARQRARAVGDLFPPAWADLIEACARCDLVGMNVPDGPMAPLSALLRLLALEPTVLADLGLLAGKDVLALDPECYRAYDAMCRLGELLNNIEPPTSMGPDVFARTIPVKLGALGALPTTARAHLDKSSVTGTALFDALGTAGAPGADAGEPSWAVLGRMLRETRFVQVERRLYLLRGPLGVMAGRLLDQERAVVADHPYRLYLESLAVPRDKAARVLDGLIGHLDLTNVLLRSSVMLQALEKSQHPRARAAWTLALKHVDNNAYDLAELVRSTVGRDQSNNAMALLEVSPDSQYAKAVLIEKDWERAAAHLVEWEKGANNAPVLLAALARRYSDQGQLDDARRCLLRYVQFSPDQWAYELLAKGFKDRGDMERWRSTLDEFLEKAEDNGRSHAQVRVQLADYLMGQEKWGEAWPYAEAAAVTGAQWALVCAAHCAEGKKDWPAAERYTRQITENNPGGGWAAWYLFCKRTGHGDAEAAGALAERVLAKSGDGPGVTPPTAIGYFYWLRGDPKKAGPYFRKAYDAAPSASTCSPLILIADELGDAEARDEWIQTLLSRYRNQAPFTAQIFEILRKANEKGKPDAIDLQAIDRVLGKIRVPAYRGNNEFFAGCYLKDHGKVEEARRHMEQALRSTTSNRFMRAIAADRLQRLGVDITAIGAGPDAREQPPNR
jgi:tetratricopeptide (TPR) repeat protein